MSALTNEITFVLATRLLADAPLAALVGDRVRPGELKQSETLPAVTYELVNKEGWHSLQGGTTHARSRVQFNCYGRTKIASVTVARAIKDSLDGFRGTLGSVFIDSCMLDNEYDTKDPPESGSAEWRQRRVIDFTIVHSES